MAKSLNRCTFIGRLTRDPEQRFMPTGDQLEISTFTIAVDDDYKERGTGQKVERAEFIPLEAIGPLATICNTYLTKGKQVYVEGQFRVRKYEKDGQTRYTTTIRLENMQMLGSRGDGEGSAPPQRQAAPAPAARPAPRPAPNFSDMDDGIPF